MTEAKERKKQVYCRYLWECPWFDFYPGEIVYVGTFSFEKFECVYSEASCKWAEVELAKQPINLLFVR